MFIKLNKIQFGRPGVKIFFKLFWYYEIFYYICIVKHSNTNTMEEQILELLKKTLPSKSHIIVQKRKSFYGSFYIKIMFAPTNVELHRVSEQFPQVVSLSLDLDTMELEPQIYGGMGGQCIYRKPNLNDPRERFLAMKSVKVPFKKPIREEKYVLSAIERFCLNWVKTLKENRSELMYQDVVNYDDFLDS